MNKCVTRARACVRRCSRREGLAKESAGRCEQRQMRNCHLRRGMTKRNGERRGGGEGNRREPGGSVVKSRSEKKWRARERKSVGGGRVGGKTVREEGTPMPPLCTLQGCCNLPYLVGGLHLREVNSPPLPSSARPANPSPRFMPLFRWKFYESWNLVWRNESENEA